MSILLNVLLVIYVLVAVLMILVILMQRPKSEGLGAAFGGGVTENIFGAQTTNVLTKITGWLAGIFFFLTFGLSVLYAHQTNTTSGLRKQLEKMAPASDAAMPAAIPGAPDAALPAQPGPAVGPPGSVTNAAPGPAGAPDVGPGGPVTPADQAVGLSVPALSPSEPVQAPPASAQPTP